MRRTSLALLQEMVAEINSEVMVHDAFGHGSRGRGIFTLEHSPGSAYRLDHVRDGLIAKTMSIEEMTTYLEGIQTGIAYSLRRGRR